MKKTLCAILLAVLMFATTVTAFAASPEYGTVVAENSTAVDAAGESLPNITFTPVDLKAETSNSALEYVSSLKDSSEIPFEDPRLAFTIEMKDNGTSGNTSYPITVTLKAPGVTSDSKVVIFYDKNNNGFKDPASVGMIIGTCEDGIITFTIDGCYTFSVFIDSQTANAVDVLYLGTTVAVSPDTFDYNYPVIMIALGLLIAAAGVTVLTAKKSRV